MNGYAAFNPHLRQESGGAGCSRWSERSGAERSGAGKGRAGRGISQEIWTAYPGAMDIRAARETAGLSQSELARAAGVPQPNMSAYENGRRVPSPDVLSRIRAALRVAPSERLRRHRDEVLKLVIRHHAGAPRLFGSTARGEDGPDSDLDIVVDFTEDARFFDEIGLRLALSDLLGVEVDLIGSDSLRGEFGARVRAEAVSL